MQTIRLLGVLLGGLIHAKGALALAISSPSTSGRSPQVVPPKDPPAARKDRKEGYSLIPAIAANSTYGLMLGGAAIAYIPLQLDHKITFIAVATKMGKAYSLLDYDRQGSHWTQGIRLLANNFFESYYGNTRKVYRGRPDEIAGESLKVKPYFGYRLSESLSTQLLWDYRARSEEGRVTRSDGRIDHTHIYPDEKTHAFGLGLVYDERRDNAISPVGSYGAARVLRMPAGVATTVKGQEAFTLWTIDLRHHMELHSKLTLASRFFSGTTQGKPTYSFTYAFGGTTEMRGYGFSRFLGKKFYLGQWEARFPIYKIISGAAFYELGDITYESFSKPIQDAGLGLKIALPPDYVAKLRIELGIGQEPPNFIMEADHAF